MPTGSVTRVYGGNGRYTGNSYGYGNNNFTEIPDDGPARDALNEFGERIRGLDRYKQGGASRVERGVSAGRSAVANNIRRSGANAGSLAAMQIAADTSTGAFNQATANEAEFQRGIDNDIIGGLGQLSGLEISRDNSLAQQGLARDSLSLDRDRFAFDRERYDDESSYRDRLLRDLQNDPNAALRELLERMILNGEINHQYQAQRQNRYWGGTNASTF